MSHALRASGQETDSGPANSCGREKEIGRECDGGPKDQLKRSFAVWGKEVTSLDLMSGMKEQYDPAVVLGCGRFVTGL